MSLLEVRDLRVYYPAGHALFHPRRWVRAVDGVSFDVDSGEIVGLVGESGCGKSTVGKAIVRLEEPRSGTITLDGTELTALSGRKLRRVRKDFQMVFQDPYGSLNPRLTVAASIDEVLTLHAPAPRPKRKERIAELLSTVGIDPELMDRYPHQFSGGQRQRIGIARALAANPKIIIADEPVSALDVSVQASIINLLAELRRTTGISFLFIAHDLAVVAHISSRIIVMYLGHIMEIAPSRTIVERCRHPYTRALLSAVPEIDGDRTGAGRIVLSGDVPSPLSPPSGCPFHPRCPRAEERCRRETPVLTGTGDGGQTACFHPFEY